MTAPPDPRWRPPAQVPPQQPYPTQPQQTPYPAQQPPTPQPLPGPPPDLVEPLETFDELPEEDEELEERLARRRRRVGSTISFIAGTLAAIIVFAFLLESGLLPWLDNFSPTDLEESDLTAPEVPSLPLDLGDPEPATSSGLVNPAYRYSISWVTSEVFVGRGGVMRVNVTNNGATDFFVREVRMVAEWADPGDVYSTGWGRLVPTSEEIPIGLLAFDGPDAFGFYEYHFEIDLLVKRLTGTWAGQDVSTTEPSEMEVRPADPVPSYPMYRNDRDIYRKVNDLVQPDHAQVVSLAEELSANLGDSYNLYWLASLFDWVISELEYRSDPSAGDVWSPAGQTCILGTGDCEDFSILIASVVERWGGNARFYIISNHAFAGIYVGPPELDVNATAAALNRYYGTSARYSWFKDDLGFWIIADGTASQFLGGLPYNGQATDDGGGWDIANTEYLYITDIYPDYPE